MDKPLKTYINGVLTDTISSGDRGLQFGDGVFETIAVRDGQPLLLDAHLARLREGAERLHIESPPTHLILRDLDRLCAGAARAVLKIILTRGDGGRGYRAYRTPPTRIATLWSWPAYGDAQRQGIDLTLCETPLACNPRLAGIKHLNRLEQVLARAEWNDEYAEGLMRDERGNIVCGTMSNVFIVKAGRLLTPALNRCGIRGIMRGAILECALEIGIAYEERALSLADVQQAQEIFVSNSLIGIWPVKMFQQRRWGIGEITAGLQTQIAHKRYAVVGV